MKITIYCPSCGRKSMIYDGKATMPKSKECKKCKKIVVYNPLNGTTKLFDKKQRQTSSGYILG